MQRPTTFWLSPWFLFTLAGYLIRLAVMPLTGQNDVLFMPWMAHFINLGHPNLYAYLHDTFGDVVMHDPAVWAPYPYGFYAYTSLWLEGLKTVGLVDLTAWDTAWQVASPARLVFLFKAAYLPFDFAIACMLYRTAGKLGLALWAWSPAAIYTPFMMGQNDIYATAFAVAGACTAAQSLRVTSNREAGGNRETGGDKGAAGGLGLNRWSILTSILLGVGAIFKVYPLLLLPALVLLLTPNWRTRFLLGAIGGAIYAVAALPFMTTPTFVQGVLLNVEGTRALGGSVLPRLILPPFVFAYVLLLCAIAATGKRAKPPQAAWSVSFVVLAALFLLAPAPFYWLIWLTPFSIALTGQRPHAPWAWLALQLAFVFALFVQHRELGVALPIHLSSVFNVPNYPAALSLIHARVGLLFAELALLLSRSLLWASLLIALLADRLHVIRAPKPSRTFFLAAVPTSVMVIGLILNLVLARNLVTQDRWENWKEMELKRGDVLVQQLPPEENRAGPVTGLRVHIGGAQTDTIVTACLYRSRAIDQEPLACAQRSVNHQAEYRQLYFLFERAVQPGAGDTPVVTLQAEGADAAVTLLYVEDPAAPMLHLSGAGAGHGLLDLVFLRPFDASQAFGQLIGENVWGDRVLPAAIVVTASITVLFVAALFRKPAPALAE